MPDETQFVEWISGPSNLLEFIEQEIRLTQKAIEIDEHNLGLIEAGDHYLSELYGGQEKAKSKLDTLKKDLELERGADEALRSGDEQPARDFLDRRISELNEIINASLGSGANQIMQMHMTELNILRNIRDKK